MATAEQIKSLIRSHVSDESERFFTIALQMAAHEAQQGHGELAHDIRLIVDKAKEVQSPIMQMKFPPDLHGLVLAAEPQTPLSALVVPATLKARVDRIIHEYMQQQKLKKHGLSHRRKILLIGPPGTGKTMTARVLAHELRLKLFTIQVDKLVTKFMGETSAKLRQIFDLIEEEPGLYFFDEFDAIGGERMLENDVGEMRRVLNSFLQFVEQDTSDSLIVAATNSPKLLDRALFRRFDDVIYYEAPDAQARPTLMRNVLGTFVAQKMTWKSITEVSKGLSHAEIDQACRDAIKQAILTDREAVDTPLLSSMLRERQDSHGKQRG